MATDPSQKYTKAIIKNQEMPIPMVEDIMTQAVTITQE